MLTRSLNLRETTAQFFSETETEVMPETAQQLLIALDAALKAEEPEPSFLYGGIKAEAILPIAETVAQTIYAEMKKRLIDADATRAEIVHFKQLGTAFCAVARLLDRDATDEDSPAYHSRTHNLMVMATRLVRGRALFATKDVTPAAMIAEMRDLVTAMGHDLGHDGSSNTMDGVYDPGRLEQVSNALLQDCLAAADVPLDDRLYMAHTLLATDPELPGTIAAYAHQLHFGTGVLAQTRGALVKKIESLPVAQQPLLQNLMRALELDPQLTFSAMALKSADMVPSFGLGLEPWLEQTRLLNREITRTTPTRPIVDAHGMPKPVGPLFVMLNYVGAELCQRGGATAAPRAFLLARFMDPETDRLFGSSLRMLQERCMGQAKQEATGVVTGFLRQFGLDLK